MVYLEIVLETKYMFIALGMCECGSVVEHSEWWLNSARSFLHYNRLPVERHLTF